jgi:hypothetical protein
VTARREFITLLAGAAGWPITARAQQGALAFMGFLSGVQLDDLQLNAFRQGLTGSG